MNIKSDSRKGQTQNQAVKFMLGNVSLTSGKNMARVVMMGSRSIPSVQFGGAKNYGKS